MSKKPKPKFRRHKPITPIIRTLIDLRDYLKANSLIGPNAGVENFNDLNNREDVLIWISKFADEHDPQKV